ncbi:hypothetical protein CORC01_05273 [Colletotrichum orchidophilum]|uniref:Uncharacterized protein n=1 Tax=Colletotrichum orchidophilum TaxID=1209926 RepID=A0A1G4BDM4_9PEZI|nr:uncharacterized protein CORC01_05273 [Colletotrichum orchidophilum]OHE99473.1 hypothetical protein CORC01_05273 [Colletotrichum orchidophilum]
MPPFYPGSHVTSFDASPHLGAFGGDTYPPVTLASSSFAVPHPFPRAMAGSGDSFPQVTTTTTTTTTTYQRTNSPSAAADAAPPNDLLHADLLPAL